MSITQDTAAVRADAQRAVDRLTAARVELQAAIENLGSVRTAISTADAEALAFIDQYMNPTLPNPAPIVPEVAAPQPTASDEPPVFTTVQDNVIAADNSSGGQSPVAPSMDVLTPDPQPPTADGSTASGAASAPDSASGGATAGPVDDSGGAG